MNPFFNEYADIVLNNLLCLQKNEILSINADEKDIDIARMIANKALLISENIVKIVLTKNHKPSDVIDFEPDHPAKAPEGVAMLTLQHSSGCENNSGNLLKDDMPSIQKFGHLAEPAIGGRRISVPWFVMNVEDSEENISNIKKQISKGVDDSILSATYRKRFLEESHITSLHITGKDTDFVFSIPANTVLSSPITKLSNGRQFTSSIDFDNLLGCIDKDSLNGKFKCKARLMNKMQEVEFEFREGKLFNFTVNDDLIMLFSFDEKLMLPGYYSICDNKFSLYLGGSIIETLKEIPDCDKELPGFFNDSLYTIELVLENRLNIEGTDVKGNPVEISRDGILLN